MYKTKSELYELVRDLMEKDKFEGEITKRYEEYQGLLAEDAIAYLIVDEMGKNVVDSASISDFKNGENVSLEVVVTDIPKPREFTRKDGSCGQVVNIKVADKTGFCRLTLWDKDVEAVKNGIIKIDSIIRIVNGYVKISDFGSEINIGRWGLFFVKE